MKTIRTSLASLLAAAALYADGESDNQQQQQQQPPQQQQMTPEQQKACEPPKPVVCCPPVNPGPFGFAFPIDRKLNCPADFFVHADALVFQAKQDGMEFAIKDELFTYSDYTTPNIQTITNGIVEGFSADDSDWDYNPGMRIGMGFFLGQDRWTLDFNWTWLNITDYQKASATTEGAELLPLWLLGTGTSPFGIGPNASAVWDASYNTLDIRFAKPYHISRYLVFTPHVGGRAAWIDQHFSVDYSGKTGTGSRVIHHADNDFWGVGLRSGLDSNWMLGKSWTLFGNIAGSMLFGQFDLEQNLFLAAGDQGFDLEDDFYQNVPNMEIALGIGWGKYFSKHQYRIDFRAGYEFHVWWDQLNLRRFWSGSPAYANDVVSRGNLTLNGFSFKLQLDL